MHTSGSRIRRRLRGVFWPTRWRPSHEARCRLDLALSSCVASSPGCGRVAASDPLERWVGEVQNGLDVVGVAFVSVGPVLQRHATSYQPSQPRGVGLR